MRLFALARKYIKQHGLFECGDSVLVAVSGGPDSVALLHVLYELRDEFALRLEVAHLQHGMRGNEAREDAGFVAELAEKLNLPFHLKELNLPGMRAEAGKGNLEALARAARYRFFGEVAKERKIGTVATAHTRDDQAETVLMWMFRGSGRKGLGGMAPIQMLNTSKGEPAGTVVVIRPLLDISKSEILAFLQGKKLPYRLDRTNRDTYLLRNWIRVNLMPQLERKFGPKLPARLANQARMLRQEEDILDGFSRAELGRIRRAGALDRQLFLEQPPAMQRRVLRLWIAETRGDLRAVDFDHIESLIDLIANGPPQGRLAIPGAWDLVKEYESIRLIKRSGKPAKTCYSYELRVEVPLFIPEADVMIESERLTAPPVDLPDDPMEAVFDLDALSQSLSVRNFRNGDRLQPLGMRGHKKVKDLFIEKKISLPARANWPLVIMGQEILWIAGVVRSDLARVDRRTTSILRLKARRSNP